MTEHSFTLFADYFQFYLQDEHYDDEPDLDYDEAATTRILVEDTRLTVLTARNMDVPVTVAITDTAPPCDLSQWDHVIEASIASPSGKLAIAGCTDYLPEAARIAVPPGPLRIRALFGNLDKLSDNRLDGEDHYRLEIWPAQNGPSQTLKQG